jgi:hypothetical protein
MRNKKENISISDLKIRNHMRERERIEDADIILKCILKKCCLRVVAGLKWFRRKTSEGILL